jgi:hypothetical protein
MTFFFQIFIPNISPHIICLSVLLDRHVNIHGTLMVTSRFSLVDNGSVRLVCVCSNGWMNRYTDRQIHYIHNCTSFTTYMYNSIHYCTPLATY